MAGRQQIAKFALSLGFMILVCGLGAWRVAIAARPPDHLPATTWRWTSVSVELPLSEQGFPPGDGVEAATGYCLICHSAGMVLRQPALTRANWRAEIMKMKSAYGAPIPDDQVERIADYLAGLAVEK